MQRSHSAPPAAVDFLVTCTFASSTDTKGRKQPLVNQETYKQIGAPWNEKLQREESDNNMTVTCLESKEHK